MVERDMNFELFWVFLGFCCCFLNFFWGGGVREKERERERKRERVHVPERKKT